MSLNPFKMSSDLTEAYAPLSLVLPFEAPQGEQWSRFVAHLEKPLPLVTPTKDIKEFDGLVGLMSYELKTDGDRPVLSIQFSEKGWDHLAYLFLTDMAKQVKTKPKSVPRSMRMFANLMNKLTPEPIGSEKADTSRKIVIDRAIEQIAPGLRTALSQRVYAWKP